MQVQYCFGVQTVLFQQSHDVKLSYTPAPTLVASTGVTNAHGPSPPANSMQVSNSKSFNYNRKSVWPRSLRWMEEQSGANISWSVASHVVYDWLYIKSTLGITLSIILLEVVSLMSSQTIVGLWPQ